MPAEKQPGADATGVHLVCSNASTFLNASGPFCGPPGHFPAGQMVVGMRTSWRWCWVLAAMALAASPGRADEPTPQQIEFFEKQVRPVLVARCHDCHAGETAESKFRADSRAALLKGGLRGPAIVPGDPEKSLMILAVNHADQLHMPPKSKIPQKEIAVLSAWVKQGTFWPNEAPVAAPADKPADKAPLEPTFTDKQKRHWSFQRPAEPKLPGVQKNAWVQSPIDAFVLARLEASGAATRAPCRSAHAHPPRDVRPDRPAADADGDRRLSGRRLSRRLRESGRPSAGRRRITASAGAGTGSTWPAMPTRTASTRTWPTAMPGAIATMSSRLQRGQAVRPFSRGAAGRRPAPRR